MWTFQLLQTVLMVGRRKTIFEKTCRMQMILSELKSVPFNFTGVCKSRCAMFPNTVGKISETSLSVLKNRLIEQIEYTKIERILSWKRTLLDVNSIGISEFVWKKKLNSKQH